MIPLNPELHEQAKRMAADFPDAMVAIFDYDGTYLYASESHLKLMGRAPKDLIGTKMFSNIAPEDLEHTNMAYMDAMMAGTSVEIGISLIRHDGELLRVRAQAWNFEDPETGHKYMLGRTILVKD